MRPERIFWCRRPGLNWRHPDFQSSALPSELPRQIKLCIKKSNYFYFICGTLYKFPMLNPPILFHQNNFILYTQSVNTFWILIWLGYKDSNLDRGSQSPACCRYTISQYIQDTFKETRFQDKCVNLSAKSQTNRLCRI